MLKVLSFISFLIISSSVAAANEHVLHDNYLHDKINTSAQQVDFDKEVLFGGEEDIKTIHDLSEEEQHAKLKAFISNRIDLNKDGVVDEKELTDYTKHAIASMLKRELIEEFGHLDSNHNGDVTWEEFSTASYQIHEQTKHRMNDEAKLDYAKLVGTDKKLFEAADQNGDKKLTVAEFTLLRNPITNEKTKIVEIHKFLSDYDTNKDGAVSQDEYINRLKKELAGENEEHTEWVPYEIRKFQEEHDTNKDGVLKGEEIIHYIRPMSLDERTKTEVEHLIKECDADHDGKLDEQEILENKYLWTHTEATDFGKHLLDEL